MAIRTEEKIVFSHSGGALDAAGRVSGDVFDAWAALKIWLSNQNGRSHQPKPLSPRSIEVYSAIWGRFVDYLKEKGQPFDQIDAQFIGEYLNNLTHDRYVRNQAGAVRYRHTDIEENGFDHSRTPIKESVALKATQKRKYASLLNRICSDIIKNKGAATGGLINVTVFLGQDSQLQANTKTQFLSINQRLALEGLLTNQRTQFKQHPSSIGNRTRRESPTAWKFRRDLTIVAFLLSTGVRVSELRYLSVNCIIEGEGGVAVDTKQHHTYTDAEKQHVGDGQRLAFDRMHHVHAHRVIPIPSWATSILLEWKTTRLRETNGEAKPRLFTTAPSPTPARPVSVMDAATVARVVNNWGTTHAAMKLTPQRLRNTFGAKLVEEGKDLAEIDGLMGYVPGATATSGFRLREAWLSWKTHPTANLTEVHRS